MSAKLLSKGVVLATGLLAISSSIASAQLVRATLAPTIDGNLSEWGAYTLPANSGVVGSAGLVGHQYQWTDGLADDTGDGDYLYPTDWGAQPNNGPLATTDLNPADIERFHLAYDATNLYVAVKLNSTSQFYGSLPRLAIYIDDTTVATGASTSDVGDHRNFCQAPDLDFEDTFNWDYHISQRADYSNPYVYRVDGNVSLFDGAPGMVRGLNQSTGVIELSVPWTSIGGFPATARALRLFVGTVNAEGGDIRDIRGTDPAAAFHATGGCGTDGSGSCDYDFDADVWDAIGSVSQAAQEADLGNNAGCTTLPVITNSFVTLNIDPLADPRLLVTRATASPAVDGSIADWGVDTLAANTDAAAILGTVGSQYRWKDAAGDDTGDGDYTSADPLATDIDVLGFSYDLTNIYVVLKTAGGGIPRTMYYFDRSDLATGGSTTNKPGHSNFCQAPDVIFDPSFNWDFHLSNRSGSGSYRYRFADENFAFPAPGSEFDSDANDVYEMSLPWSDIGGYPTNPITMKIVAGLCPPSGDDVPDVLPADGGCDTNAGNACQGPFGPSGTDFDADLFDLVGADLAAQEADLTATAGCTAPAVVSSSIVDFDLTLLAPSVVTTANPRLYYANNMVRFNFSLPATGATVSNTANYTITGDSPDDLVVTSVGFGSGTENGNVFLTLNRAVTEAEIGGGGITIALNNSIVADDNTPIQTGSTLLVNQFQYVIPISVDAGAGADFIGTPYFLSNWNNSFGTQVPLADGVDVYPGIPGMQIEAGDVPGDRIYAGRSFTLNNPFTITQFNRNFVIKSDYDFSGLLAPGKQNNRSLVPGYWGPHNFDPILVDDVQFLPGFPDTIAPITVTKPATVINRLIAAPTTTTLRLRIPSGVYFTPAQAANPVDVQVRVQATATASDDNALPTVPADLPDGLRGPDPNNTSQGKVMTYLGEFNEDPDGAGPDPAADYSVFTTTVGYPVGIPDISDFLFGFTGVFAAEEPENGLLNWFEDPKREFITGVPPGDISIKRNTVHRHIARVTNNANTGGRTIDFTFDATSLDIEITPIEGDATGDFTLNTADVTAIYNHLAGIQLLTGQNLTNAAAIDAPDGTLTVDDVDALVDFLVDGVALP